MVDTNLCTIHEDDRFSEIDAVTIRNLLEHMFLILDSRNVITVYRMDDALPSTYLQKGNIIKAFDRHRMFAYFLKTEKRASWPRGVRVLDAMKQLHFEMHVDGLIVRFYGVMGDIE